MSQPSSTPPPSAPLSGAMTPIMRFQQQQQHMQQLRLPRAETPPEPLSEDRHRRTISGGSNRFPELAPTATSSLVKNRVNFYNAISASSDLPRTYGASGYRSAFVPVSERRDSGSVDEESFVQNVTLKNDHFFIHPAKRDIRQHCQHSWIFALLCGLLLFFVMYLTFYEYAPPVVGVCDANATAFGTYLGSSRGVAAYSNCRTTYLSDQANFVFFGLTRVSSGLKWHSLEYVQRYLLLTRSPGVYLSPSPSLNASGLDRFSPFQGPNDTAKPSAASRTRELERSVKEVWEMSSMTLMDTAQTQVPVRRFSNGGHVSDRRGNRPTEGDILVYLSVVPHPQRTRYNGVAHGEPRRSEAQGVSKGHSAAGLHVGATTALLGETPHLAEVNHDVNREPAPRVGAGRSLRSRQKASALADPTGHAAVIVHVDENFVYIAEQNWDNRPWEGPQGKYSRRIPLVYNATAKAYTIDDAANGHVAGWIRVM